MANQTNHFKLPILSFLCALGVLSGKKIQNKAKLIPVKLGNRLPPACRSGLRAGIQEPFNETNPNVSLDFGLFYKTKPIQTARPRITKRTQNLSRRSLPLANEDGYKTNPFWTNEPIFKIDHFALTYNMEISYDQYPSNEPPKIRSQFRTILDKISASETQFGFKFMQNKAIYPVNPVNPVKKMKLQNKPNLYKCLI